MLVFNSIAPLAGHIIGTGLKKQTNKQTATLTVFERAGRTKEEATTTVVLKNNLLLAASTEEELIL